MFEKIANLIFNLVAGFYIFTAAIGVIVVTAIFGSTAAVVAAIVAVFGILLKLFTTFLSKTGDRIASIYLWSYRTLENLRHLFEFLKAESFFDKEVEPKEAETKWENMKAPVINSLEKMFQSLHESALVGVGYYSEQMDSKIEKASKRDEKFKEYSEGFAKESSRGADLKMGFIFTILDEILKLYEKLTGIDNTSRSKSKGSSGGQGENQDGGKYDVTYASLEAPAEAPAGEDPVITRLDNLASQLSDMNESLQTKDENPPAGDDLTEIKDALYRIENNLGLSEITTALENLRADIQNIIQPEREVEEGATTGDKLDAIEAKLADNEARLEEKTNDIGIEVRDSKRSVLGEIAAVRARLEDLIEDIRKKAMTFDQIYNKFGERLQREVRDNRR